MRIITEGAAENSLALGLLPAGDRAGESSSTCAQTVLTRHVWFVGQGVLTDVHGRQFVVSFDEKCKTIWDGPEPLIKV